MSSENIFMEQMDEFNNKSWNYWH